MPLTDTAIRNSKPQDHPFKMADGNGLYLFVTPNGFRLWRLKYRIAGREKSLSIRAYPKMAREARDKAKNLLAAGIDPSEAKQASKRQETETTLHTLHAIANEYVAKLTREKLAKGTIEKVLPSLRRQFGLIVPASLCSRLMAGSKKTKRLKLLPFSRSWQSPRATW